MVTRTVYRHQIRSVERRARRRARMEDRYGPMLGGVRERGPADSQGRPGGEVMSLDEAREAVG